MLDKKRKTQQENVYIGENYQVCFRLYDIWDNGYNATISIENTGDTKIENWCMAFPLSQRISLKLIFTITELVKYWNGEKYELYAGVSSWGKKYYFKYDEWGEFLTLFTNFIYIK